MKWQYYNPIFEHEKIFNDLDWPWAGHKYFAYDLVRNIKPKVIVELGTHRGTSFFSMCQGVKDAKLKTKLFAVDTWKGDKQSGFYDESVFQEANKIKDAFYRKLDIKLVRKYFDEAVGDFKDGSIDLLHIDGLHTYKDVKHDFDKWLNKTTENAIIMFHDSNEKRHDYEVYKLWEELKKKYNTVEFSHSHGLGVLFRGKKSHIPAIIQLQEIWQHYYPTLFENHNLKIQLELKKNEVEKMVSESINLRNQIQQKETHIKNLETIINRIKSSKFFRLWQFYCKARDEILKHQ